MNLLKESSPCGPPGMATRVRPTYRRRYSWQVHLAAVFCTFSTFFCLSFIKGMPVQLYLRSRRGEITANKEISILYTLSS